MQIEDIQHDRIEPNPENPNEMGEGAMTALKEEIRLRGFVQPVLVRPHPNDPDRFQIIDGEHRWRLLGELGVETVPCVVDRDTGDTDARVRMLTMNRLRGQFVPIRLAHLLADLNERLPEAELRKRLDLDQAELQNYLALANFLDEPEEGGVPRPGGPPPADDRIELVFICTQEQASEVESLLTQLTGGDSEKDAAVLHRLARNYGEP